MASLGHIAVGLAAARLHWTYLEKKPQLAAPMIWMSMLALLPDADVISFTLGIPYRAPLGHRGASHSLVAALACGALCMLGCWLWRRHLSAASLYTAGFAAAVVASHGLLDSMTDGGLGVALLWPVSSHRFFAPWRPIPVAPIGTGILSERGLEVMLTELVYFLPLLLYAFWPSRPWLR